MATTKRHLHSWKTCQSYEVGKDGKTHHAGPLDAITLYYMDDLINVCENHPEVYKRAGWKVYKQAPKPLSLTPMKWKCRKCKYQHHTGEIVCKCCGVTRVFKDKRKAKQVALATKEAIAMQWWQILDQLSQASARIMLVGPPGTGKCFQEGTPILMADGAIKPVESILPGDQVMGPDSKPRKVLEIHQGRDQMYKVAPIKGEPYVVNSGHTLTLKMSNNGVKKGKKRAQFRGQIVNVSVVDYLKKSNNFKSHAKGYRAGVDFPFQAVPMEPYYLGLWLGDGSSDYSQITSADDEIVGFVEELAVRYEQRCTVTTKQGCSSVTLTGQARNAPVSTRRANLVFKALQELDLIKNKHIPLCYKANNRRVRELLLAGLLDTDGSLTCNGYDYISVSQTLANDVVYVARSLGLAAYVKPTIKKCQTGVEGLYYRVSISGDCSKLPTLLPRKKARPRLQKKDVLVTGISVKPVGEGQYYGFSVDGDHLFLLGDFTVVHNSQTAFLLLSKGSTAQRLTMTEGTAVEDLLGMFHLVEGSTVWKDGPAARAMRGGTALILDEIDKYSPEVGSLLYALLDDDPQVTLPSGEHLKAKKGYKVIATSNANVSALPEAILDRMEAVIIAAKPHPDAMAHLHDEEKAAVLSHYEKKVDEKVWQWTGTATLRRMRAYHKFRHELKELPETVAAEAAFGKNGKEIISVLATAARRKEGL